MGLYFETASWKMSSHILYRKLLFYKHIVSLGEETLAKEIFNEMKESKYPSILEECEVVFNEWNIPIETIPMYTKMSWKHLMKKKMNQRNHDQLIQWCTTYKKIDMRNFQSRPKKLDSI